jgi:starvation-inducible DNA-binding protein
MKANIGISEAHAKAVAAELNKLLANETVLYTKTRNYHWNVEGSSFMEFHKLFEGQYGELEIIIDDVAERIRSLGHQADGRLSDYLKNTDLKEQALTTKHKDQLTNLLADHETIIKQLRKQVDLFGDKYKDAGNADFVTGLMKQHEKTAWMLRAYLG